MDFLRDPIWQTIGAVISFVALLVSILFYYKQKNLKRVTYKLLISTPVLSLKEELKNQIQISIHNKLVNDVQIVVLKLWNSGNASILINDFIDPITINFEQTTEVLDAEVLEVRPSNIKAKLKPGQNLWQVVLEPLLLNSQDAITIKVLLTKYNRKIFINARVAGLKEILNVDQTLLNRLRGSKFVNLFKASLIFLIVFLPMSFCSNYIAAIPALIFLNFPNLAVVIYIIGSIIAFIISIMISVRLAIRMYLKFSVKI